MRIRPQTSPEVWLGLLGGVVGAGILAGTAQAHEYQIGSLHIEHPWSRATPPGAVVGTGYLIVRNDGTKNDRLVRVSTPAAKTADVHSMETTDGVMTMRAQTDGVLVPAGGRAVLEPGGLHLMLSGLSSPLKAGDAVPLTLTFEKAGDVDVVLKVEPLGAKSPGIPDHSQHNAR